MGTGTEITQVLSAKEALALHKSAILPVDRTALEAARQEWQSILEAYRDLPCSTLEEEDQWADWLNAAHAVVKANEKERLALTGPLNDELKAVAKDFNDSVAPAIAFKKLASEKLAAAKDARKLAEEAAKAAAQLAAQTGDHEGVYTALATVGVANEKIAGTTGRVSVTVEVVDINLVDRALLVLDEKKAIALYKLNGNRGLPGLKFTTTTKVQPNGRSSK